MSEKISKNLRMNLFITLFIGILNFVVNKYFTKYMGIDTLGLMKLFTQMIAYLSLVDLGISNASSYALYRPLVEKDELKINLIVSTIDSFYKKIAVIILIIGGALSFLIPYFIKIDFYGKNLYFYWILYVVNTSIGYSFAKYSILFTANQEYGFVRKIQGLGKIIFQIFQILVIIKMKSFYLFIFIMILENFYSYYFYSKHYRKNYNYIIKVKERDKNIVKDMKNLFWHKIGTVVVHNTDYILLSKFVSLSIVGIYSSYLIVYQTLMTLIGILTPVLTPKIGIFVVNHTKEEIYKYWKGLYSIYIFIATIFIICTYILIEPFMNLWLGKEFFLSKISIILILINLFIHLIRGITDSFKTSCGFFDDTYTPGLESLLNFIFSFLLVQKIGLNGVILGTVISNIAIILLLKPILVFQKCFGKSGLIYIKDTLKLFTLSFISMGAINILALKLTFMTKNIISWKQFIINTTIIGIISLLITSILFILDKEFREFIKELKKGNKKC